MAYPYDNRVYSTIAAIAECLCSQLAENELPSVCFCGIIAGQQPYDATGIGDGCEDGDDGCGQAWVRLVTAYPSTTVGVANLTPNNCGSGFGFDLEVGVMRCIRIEEEGGALPADEMLEATQLQVADMVTMQQALSCCPGLDAGSFVLGQYTPLGPDGGLVGGSWQISVLVD